MKSGRAIYAAMMGEADAARSVRLSKLKGRDLLALEHYAVGREDSASRDELISLVVCEAARRYFVQAAKKQAKLARRAKGIL